MNRKPWLAALALALLAPAALASAPRSSAPLTIEAEAAPSLTLERALASDESSRFALALFAGDELRPETHQELELSYPKTRVWGLRLSGAELHRDSSELNAEGRWGCAEPWLRTAEGTGSWLSEDPAGDVDSPNRYAYVGWRPNHFTDPTGEFAFLAIPAAAAVGKAVGIGLAWGLAAHFAVDEAAREIDYETSVDPDADVFDAGVVGFGRGAVIGGTAALLGGGAGGLALRAGWGTVGSLTAGGAAAGFGSTLGADISDVGILGTRDLSAPADYALSTAIGGGLGLGAGGVAALGSRLFPGSMTRGAYLREKYGQRYSEYIRQRVQQGALPKNALRLARPYGVGPGSEGQHFIQKHVFLQAIARYGADSWRGKALYWYRDSLFNRWAPNMPRGRFYELHSRFHARRTIFGGAAPQQWSIGSGQYWHASKVSPPLEPFGSVGYLWYSSPPALKAVVGGAAAGAAYLLWDW